MKKLFIKILIGLSMAKNKKNLVENDSMLELTKIIKLLLDMPSVESAIKSLIESNDNTKIRANELEIEKLNNLIQRIDKSNKFWIKRYWQDIFLVGIAFCALIILSVFSFIDKQIIGTLFGTILGYALSRLKKQSNEAL